MRISGHQVTDHASAVTALYARLDDEIEILENIADMVDRLIAGGDQAAARDLLAEAQTHRDTVARITALIPA